MSDAVKRLQQAIDKSRSPSWIYGDYDVDGTTGTAVAVAGFAYVGSHCPVITCRIASPRLWHSAGRFGKKRSATVTKLVVSVDCGIPAHEPLALGAREWSGHHHYRSYLPDEDEDRARAAVLNPNQNGCDYPDKNLAGSALLSN